MTTTPTQSCWTCKKRKIRCDRRVPTCDNCDRTGRECQGYEIKLQWETDKKDGRRRPQQQLPAETLSSLSPIESPDGRLPEHYGRQFLNVTFADIEHAGRSTASSPTYEVGSPLKRSLSSYTGSEMADSDLLTYYEERTSCILAAINTRNEFRTKLIPMAWSGAGFASDALRNAILAVAAFHRFSSSEMALSYKTKAITSLSQSFSLDSGAERMINGCRLATSLMLCFYNVLDEADGNWHLHLNGARHILTEFQGRWRTQLQSSLFLYCWFLRHETLGSFFSQIQQKSADENTTFHPENEGEDNGVDRAVIVGLLGCSLEVMMIINAINRLRAFQEHPVASSSSAGAVTPGAGGSGSRRRSSDTSASLHNLERRLTNLQQRPDPELTIHSTPTFSSSSLAPIDQSIDDIIATAELYRLAAWIYLRRSFPPRGEDAQLPVIIDQAFDLLESLSTYGAGLVWPLFVIACQAETDSRRIDILRVVDRMTEADCAPNVGALRSLIEAFWTQRDLRQGGGAIGGLGSGGGGVGVVGWWDCMKFRAAAPWFA